MNERFVDGLAFAVSGTSICRVKPLMVFTATFIFFSQWKLKFFLQTHTALS